MSIKNVAFPEDYISISQGPATVTLTFQVCNDGDAIPINIPGTNQTYGQLLELNVGATKMEIVSVSNSQAGTWFAVGSNDQLYIANQIADIPAGACADIEIVYNVSEDTEDGSGPISTGLNCAELNIQPHTLDVGQDNACRDEEDDQIQVCTHTRDGSILPLQLLSFDAHLINAETNLSWATAFEDNVSRFEVEKSPDGESFAKIGSKQSEGGLLSGSGYQFIDKSPNSGLTFYRLKMIDLDGSFDYSPIREVRNLINSESRISLYPNPASHILRIEGELQTEANAYLLDARGQIIRAISNFKGTAIPVSELANGIYFIRIEGSEDSQTHKFEVLR